MKKRIILAGLLLASMGIAGGCQIDFSSLRYNVDFYVDGELYQSVGTDGKKIEMPKNPTKDGYQFDGWYTEADGEGELITLYTILNQPLSEDIRLSIYAHFLEEITVSFVTGTDEVIADAEYLEGDTMSALTPNVTPEDMLFNGWFTDEKCTQKWDMETKLDEDMTLYAGWIDKYVTITYIYNIEGMENTTVQATRFETISQLTPDNRTDETFLGWYTDENLKTEWDFNDPVQKDMTLYGKWQSKYVTVTYDYQHESFTNKTVKLERGERATELSPDPIPLYHDFLGWCKYSYGGLTWDFNKPIEQDMTLYANWKDHTGEYVHVTYVYTDGYRYSGSTRIGDLIEDRHQVVQTGERFVGWFLDENFTQPWDILNDRADKKDITLYAKKERALYTLSFDTPGLQQFQNYTAYYGDSAELPYVSKENHRLAAWLGTLEDGSTIRVECKYTGYSYIFPYTHRYESNVVFTPIFESFFTFEKIPSENAYALTNINAHGALTIDIPSTYNGLPVTRIEEEACINNQFVRTITIPDSVTYIGKNAFEVCSLMTEVTIGAGVTEIDAYAFYYCEQLTKINFNCNNLKTIGNGAFSRTKVQKLILPDTVETLGSISSCEYLSSLYLGKSLKTITTSIFNCKELKEIHLPATLESVPSALFEDCYLVIYAEAASKPDGWPEDWNSTNMPVIWNSANVKTLTKDGVLYAINDDYATIVKYSGVTSSLTVPEYVTVNNTQYPVTMVAANAFYAAETLVNLSLPNTLEKVDYPQFLACNQLSYFTENGVTYLGNAENPYLILKTITKHQDTLTVPAQTRIILGHDPNTYYTTYTIGGLAFEEGSQLQYIGPQFFSWGSGPIDVFLPAGVKYIAPNALSSLYSGSIVNIFIPEESQPEGWAEDWSGPESVAPNTFYGATKDDLVTVDEATYLLHNGEATLIHLMTTQSTYSLPETVAWNGQKYPLTKMANRCLFTIQADLTYLAIPACVTEPSNTLAISVNHSIDLFLWEMEYDPNLTLSGNCIYGVTTQDYIMQENAHFIIRGDYAEAYRFLGKGTSDNPTVCILPKTVTAYNREITVSHISRRFIGDLKYVQIYFHETVTTIPTGITYGYGVSIYTAYNSDPKGWETDWNECYRGGNLNPINYIPVTYGVTGVTDDVKTYTFMVNGEQFKQLTAPFAPSAPTPSVSGKYFWGWYDNAELTGNIIEFPYVGESTTFYARFENEQIQDGKTQDTAYVLTVGSYIPVNITKPGQTVYFKYTVEKEQAYTFKSRGDCDTIGKIYYMRNVVSILREETVATADTGGSGENFSMTETLTTRTYYFTVKLVDSTQTGSFEVILSAM